MFSSKFKVACSVFVVFVSLRVNVAVDLLIVRLPVVVSLASDLKNCVESKLSRVLAFVVVKPPAPCAPVDPVAP